MAPSPPWQTLPAGRRMEKQRERLVFAQKRAAQISWSPEKTGLIFFAVSKLARVCKPAKGTGT